MAEQSSLGQWLEQRCQEERLSLRQAAAKTGLSHGTIRDIIRGVSPSSESIKKLAHGFGGNGKQGLALEDKLLVLAGYRSDRPGEDLSESMAELMDKVKQLSESQIQVMIHFADFLAEVEASQSGAVAKS